MARSNHHFKDHWKEQRLFLSRVIGSGILVVVLTGVLIARLVELQVVDYQRFSDLSQGNQLKIEPLAPTRGLIFDRNGLTIAENIATWQLVAVPEQIDDVDAMLGELELLGLLDPGNRPVLIDLIRSHRRFQRVTLTNLTEVQAATFAARRHRYPGIDIQEGLIRYYPYGEAVAHAIGYVGSISTSDLEQIDRGNYSATSQIGKSGIERSYESLLHGTAGYRQQVVNAAGRVLLDPAVDGETNGNSVSSWGLEIETRWPEPGRHLLLSLDMRLQLAAQNALKGVRGAAVAIDPGTGDLLALVSAPTFDPNGFASGLSRADFVGLNTDIDKPLFNRALAGRYPPGSTVKPFLGLAGLQNETEMVAEDHYCGGYFTLPGSTHRYRDWRPQGHGPMSLHSAIVESCDVYFYQLAVELGIDRMNTFMKSFGFGARTGIDISGEDAGLFPSQEWKRNQFSRREDQVWFPGETVITGIGQGFTQVTPLQLAHSTAILAARGARFRPRLLIGTEDSISRRVEYIVPEQLVGLPPIDAEHWQIVHAAMVGATTEANASSVRAVMAGAPFQVAGKTGTSQVIAIAQEETYDEEAIDERLRDHGLFVAYAPAENPTIAVAVVVENNGGGSTTAAPIARKIFDAYFGSEEYVAKQY
jgi:penicillin-binding protein 2